MKRKIRHHHKRLFLSICLTLSLALIFVTPAGAQDGISPRDSVPTGQTIEGDTLLFGPSVSMDGVVTGDLFIIGGDVKVNGEVGGSLYVIAESITTNGKIGGSTYQGALELVFGPSSTVGRNAYLLGVNLSTGKGSQVANDLIAGALQGWLSGEVGRFMRSIIIILNVEGQIGNGIDEPEESPEGDGSGDGSASARGVLALIRLETPLDERLPIGRLGATVPQQSIDTTNPAVEWIVEYFRKLITLLVFGGLTLGLFPIKLKKWSGKMRTAPLESGLWGLIAILVAIMVSVVVLAVIPGIVILLWKLTFWGLASVLLAFGYTSYGLAVILFIIATIYISKVIVSYLIGELILQRFAPRFAERLIWSLLLGAVIFMALFLIPTVGWIFGFLAALAGLGAMWLVYREPKESKQELDVIDVDASAVEEPVEVEETDIVTKSDSEDVEAIEEDAVVEEEGIDTEEVEEAEELEIEEPQDKEEQNNPKDEDKKDKG